MNMKELHESPMNDVPERCLNAGMRLYEYLLCRHLQDGTVLVGPDCGVRWNLRYWRFVKSYLRFLPWQDNYLYLQAQAYWILDNLTLFTYTNKDQYLQRAIDCANVVVEKQTKDGYWNYPGGSWTGMIATVENCFAAIGLLRAYSISGNAAYFESAQRWYRYMVTDVGFQNYDAEALAVNYFANAPRGLVPNNSTLALWFCAELAKASGDSTYLEYCSSMCSFLRKCQLSSGELPYSIKSGQGIGRTHYLCFQYNAFELMDLIDYYRLTNDESIKELMINLASYVSTGFTSLGNARYNCDKDKPILHYHTAALSAALTRATAIGLGDYSMCAVDGYERLLSVQNTDGSFDHSWGDYGILSDRRSYPRNQSMILCHLLVPYSITRN